MSIELTPPSATLQEGATQQFAATAHFSDGGSTPATVTWSATGGTVSASGLYTAGSVAGNYQVAATEQGGSISKAAAVAITVAPPVLTSISVAPATVALAPSATQQFAATGHYSGGGTGSVAVNWTATGGTITPAGLYTAGTVAGPFVVTATVSGGSIAGTSAVTISAAPPTLTSITVAPATVTLAPNATQPFTATAHYSDASSGPATVDWTAAGGTIDAAGLYTAGTTDGTYEIRATATGGSVFGTASATIATPPPNLVAIEIVPDTLVRLMPNPATFQYSALGRLSNGSTTPVAVTWAVTSAASPPANLPLNQIAADGLFTSGFALGSYRVIATVQGGSLADTATVNVHGTGGQTVQGPTFWNPVAGTVYLCTSNHFTDDAAGPAGVATVTALPAGGEQLPPSMAYSTGVPVLMNPQGDGYVAVVCQLAWQAPGALVGQAQVTIDVVPNRPGRGMAKGFIYTKLHCFNPAPPAGDGLERPCGRTDYTTVAPWRSSPPWTTTPVSLTVTVSATEGANIWFKTTDVP